MNRLLRGLAVFIGAFGRPIVGGLESLTRLTRLTMETLYWVFVGPFTGKTRFRKLVFPLMQQIGVFSLFITCLVAVLIGAILVLQTGDKFEDYGAKNIIPKMICIAIVRELGPLMTAIVLSGRVGAAFTAGLGSMVINEEVLALRTMGINPVGYLVAPRFIAIFIMLPVLTMYSYLFGNIGGLVVGTLNFNIPFWSYYSTVRNAFDMVDIIGGLVKAAIFGGIICMVACHNALTVRGGPEGVGRNTMVSVVMSLVSIIVADALIDGVLLNRFYK